MDWDMEMEDVPAVADYTTTVPATLTPQEQQNTADPSSREAGGSVLYNKVHLRGLDSLNTNDVKAYVKEHFGPADKLEWIDDTSANLVFSSESAASDAFIALSAVEIADPKQLSGFEYIPAKALASNPNINLEIRFAVSSDRKQPGAASRSRFYLLNPDYDPEERQRREESRRYRDRTSIDGYKRRGIRSRRDYDISHEIPFDASFYDDGTGSPPKAPRRSTSRSPSSGSERVSYARHNQQKELFPSHRSNRDRERDGRSVSPSRLNTFEKRLSSNRETALQIKGQLKSEPTKELFPSKVLGTKRSHITELEGAVDRTTLEEDSLRIKGTTMLSSGGIAIKGAANSARELFPDKLGPNSAKELFADKLHSRARPRQKAEDLFY